MDNDESISRNRKMDNPSDHDFLSDLPLNIIHCILALVPIRDAVRTCILSSKWRYKWASLPQLVFDDNCMNRRKSVECLKNIVSNALLLHEGPIQKFRLHTSILNNCPDTDRWLLYLSRNEIRELWLGISHPLLDGWYRVHSSLYSCRKLTHLELLKCELRPPPLTFKGFSYLRSLVLRCVKVASDVVESLVANSPLLENFVSHYSADAELRISAPNLKCVHLAGDFKEISLYAPVLAKVSVEFSNFRITAEQQQSSVCNYAKFLSGFTNLESLDVFCHFTKYLSIGIESYDHSLVFHHLKSITLSGVNFEYKKRMAVLGHLIMGAPNLHELIIFATSRYSPNASEAPPLSYSDFGWAPNLTFNRLRVIHMYDFSDDPLGMKMEMDDLGSLPNMMEFIKILLRSSKVLETITLSACRLGPDVILMLMTKLRSYSRASPNAKISLRLSSGSHSCKKLEGPIPPAMGLLNLSHNYLSGSIPDSFSDLEQIGSLQYGVPDIDKV